MNFTYDLPVNLIFGRGKINELAVVVSKYGKRALLVTGTSSTKKSGLLHKTIELLKEANVESIIFDKVTQNPLDTIAYDGANLAISEKCDCVVGLGGGSIMDTAKAIAFIVKNTGNVFDYIYGLKVGREALPIVLVPTTCGTGSEGNGFAVLTNSKTKDKKSLRSNSIIAKASIIDPELMTTMPKYILASVGFDALAHNMEAYLSKICNPLVESQALYGMKLIVDNLPNVYKDSHDLDAWEKVSLGSTIGGMVIGTAGVVAPHGLEHPASGLRDIVHGKGLAALTPYIVEKSWESDIKKYSKISKILGTSFADECSIAIKKFLKKIDLNVTLRELGVRSGDIDWMTENSFKVSKVSIENHPKVFTEKDIKDIYYKSL